MGDRLTHFRRHDALLLLRHSFAIPKILYILRTSPCFLSSKLSKFDFHLRSIISAVLNINLDKDSTWIQASLPVSAGGIGFRSAVQLAPSAFLASAAGCNALLTKILPPHLQSLTQPEVEAALNIWNIDLSASPPAAPDDSRQKAWDKPKIKATFESLLENAQDPFTKARLLGAATKESGAWLNAPPVSSLGLRMDDDAVTISIGLRLGAPLCRPHTCRLCGSPVTQLATHGLSCLRSQGRHPRHNKLNDIIHRSLAAAGVPSQLEPLGLSRQDGKRPDGVTVMPWRQGRSLIWDATCSDTFAASYVNLASTRAGAVADQAERRKTAMYNHLLPTHLFYPVSIETSGAFGEETAHFIQEIGRRLQDKTNDPQAYQHLLQRLSVAVQRGNVLAVLGSINSNDTYVDF